MKPDTARKELDDLIAKSINIDDFAVFAKHQRKIEAAKVKVAYADARAQADLRREQAEAAAADEAEHARQQRVVQKMRQRLEEHLTDDCEKLLDQLITTYETGDELFKDICDINFNLEPDFIGLFRPEDHVHQLCRCLHSRGFRPIIDAIKNYHPGPLADEVQMADFLRDVNFGDVANENDALATDGGAEK